MGRDPPRHAVFETGGDHIGRLPISFVHTFIGMTNEIMLTKFKHLFPTQ